jgi:hypothetical protein
MIQIVQIIIMNARFDDDSKINKWKMKNEKWHFTFWRKILYLLEFFTKKIV